MLFQTILGSSLDGMSQQRNVLRPPSRPTGRFVPSGGKPDSTAQTLNEFDAGDPAAVGPSSSSKALAMSIDTAIAVQLVKASFDRFAEGGRRVNGGGAAGVGGGATDSAVAFADLHHCLREFGKHLSDFQLCVAVERSSSSSSAPFSSFIAEQGGGQRPAKPLRFEGYFRLLHSLNCTAPFRDLRLPVKWQRPSEAADHVARLVYPALYVFKVVVFMLSFKAYAAPDFTGA